jgi:hypothetical protein
MSASAKKRADWSAWRVSDDEVRVQINRPDMARAFAKVKTTWLAGYSVAGNFIKIFHIRQPVPWVDAWMKNYLCQGLPGTCERKETR